AETGARLPRVAQTMQPAASTGDGKWVYWAVFVAMITVARLFTSSPTNRTNPPPPPAFNFPKPPPALDPKAFEDILKTGNLKLFRDDEGKGRIGFKNDAGEPANKGDAKDLRPQFREPVRP